MTVTAKTQPADISIDLRKSNNQLQLPVAVSVHATFETVSELVDLSVPVRRPAKAPLLDSGLSSEISAWEAASDEAWDSLDD